MNRTTKLLNEEQVTALEKLVNEITPEQVTWINGYLEGVLAANNVKLQPDNGSQTNHCRDKPGLTILYGTDTGRSKKVAERLAEKASDSGIISKVENMYDYKAKNIKDETNLAIIVSTHGEGEPPDMAEDFHSFITGKRAPRLENLNYSVLALGDKSYKFFCKTGVDIDESVKSLGAKTIIPIVKCDVDYEEDAEEWSRKLLDNLVPAASEKVNGKQHVDTEIKYSSKNPFYAAVLDKVRITGRDSDKEVYHLELSLEDSGIKYEPGDSLGVFPKNPDDLVNQIIKVTGIGEEEKVILKSREISFKEALTHHLEITVLNRDVLQNYFAKTSAAGLKKILSSDKELDDYLYGNDVLDLLSDFPYNWRARELEEILRPLYPRLYSISSSQDSVEDEVHITVSLVSYNKKGRDKLGACSSYLANDIEIDSRIPVYVEKNPAFKLPPNGSKVIMVGAGTGIAPYRSFLQQRESLGVKGNTWLFFGDRRFSSDFLYQVEWQKLLKNRYLEKMDVAFSRDQKEKIYVQHKLRERSKDLYSWIQEGAYFYLCGDRKNMAKDVNQALVEIIQAEGGVSRERAETYLKQLRREKRFQTDVY